jgi:hypothetical protein
MSASSNGLEDLNLVALAERGSAVARSRHDAAVQRHRDLATCEIEPFSPFTKTSFPVDDMGPD